MNLNLMYLTLKYADYAFNFEVLKKELPTAIPFENKETDTQGFIYSRPNGNGLNNIFIALRGTEPKLIDWLTDFNLMQTIIPYENINTDIRVHKGFITAYKSVRQTIQDYLQANKSNISNCYVMGHSLGGALATLCAVDIQYNFPELKLECYTAGSPMVGNKAFVDSYNKRVPDTMRTFIRKDIAPMFPLSWMQKIVKCTYAHVGDGTPIGPNDIFLGIKNLIINHFKSNRTMADIANHSVELYLKYLK